MNDQADDRHQRSQAPWWAKELLTAVKSLHREMRLILSDQSHLDADVTALTDGLTAIETEIANLKAANPAVNFGDLDKLVGRVKGDVPAAPAPGTTPDPGTTPPTPTARHTAR